MYLWKKRIYADAAAATPLSPSVQKVLVDGLRLFANPGALHEEAVAAKKALEDARAQVAHTIGAHPDEIIFTSGGTESNNLALFGLLRPQLRSGAMVRAVTSVVEHSSVLEPLRALVSEGLSLLEVSVSSAGLVSMEALQESITPETLLVSIQLANSETGVIQPIREIAKIIRHERKKREANGLPLYFHCDASQAPLWLSLNVEKLGVDMMTLDAQKCLGPKSVGVLYVRRGVTLAPLLLGGGQERGLRSGTEHVALAAACAVALQEAQVMHGAAAKRIAVVRNILFTEIHKRIPDVVLHGAVGDQRLPNNLNISIPGLDGQMAVIALGAEGVAASTRSACDTTREAPSHVLQAMGLSEELMQSAIRLTLLPSATPREARFIARTLQKVAKRYRKAGYLREG